MYIYIYNIYDFRLRKYIKISIFYIIFCERRVQILNVWILVGGIGMRGESGAGKSYVKGFVED